MKYMSFENCDTIRKGLVAVDRISKSFNINNCLISLFENGTEIIRIISARRAESNERKRYENN
jgi:uncharacterized DUF497 family protein